MVTFDRLTIGLVFVAIGVLACFSPAQGDTWWHLRVGFDIWRTHHVPLTDTYSYTAAGAFFPDHGWLSDVVFSGLYRLGGMPLIALGTATAIVGAWALSWRLTNGPFEAALACLLGGAAASTVSWAIRPQVFSMLALMVASTLIASKRFRLVPILILVWANVHGAVLLGLVALLAALVATAFEERRLPIELTFVTAASFAATLATPMGLRMWPEIIASLQRSEANALIEWSGPGFSGIMWPFWAMAAALPVAVVLYRRRLEDRTLTLVAIALAILPLAARSVRNVSMFMLVAGPALTALLATPDPAKRKTSRPAGERTVLNAVILVAACVGGAGVVAVAWLAQPPILGWQPFSPAAIRAVGACPDPIYNTFEAGGALIWFVPQKKVFIDNRQDPYPTDLLTAAHRVEIDGHYQALFARYDIRCAVVRASSESSKNLASDLSWVPSYTDPSWSIFVRR